MAINSPVFWLIAGLALCLLEFVVPTAFAEFILGVSALIVALVSLVLPNFGAQVALWLVLSVVMTVGLRRFLPHNKPLTLEETGEAQTLTAIPAGETGRVLYEGNSWQARCEDEDEEIPPNERVYVVGRQGNTLIVLPQHFIRST